MRGIFKIAGSTANMDEGRDLFKILVAEDDPDDCLLIRKAVAGTKAPYDLFFVSDGLQLVDFLRRQGPYESDSKAPRPDLILLDLNMPKMDGRSALSLIKKDKELMNIPVVVFSTSSASSDRKLTMGLGARSFITKPSSFQEFKSIVLSLSDFC